MKKPVSFCQSCGMPFNKEHLDKTHGNLIAKEKDGTESIYCSYCYKDGEFLNPAATMDDMIALILPELAKKIGEQAARKHLLQLLPTLARWKDR